MIQGVKIQISSDELKEHLLEKVKHHAEKSAFYTNQAKSLEEGADEHTVGGDMYNASNNPIGSIKESGKKHQQRVEFFTFLAKHLVPNEIYELTENDLVKLEVVSGMYF